MTERVQNVLPDDALVIRGGRNRPEDIERGYGFHPSGLAGISVESAVGITVEEIAKGIPHGQVGITTVGDVRIAGGDVIPTSGRSPNHATLIGLSPAVVSALLNPTQSNPKTDED